MDDDYETFRKEEEEREARNRAEISALCADLDSALENPPPGAPALARQADLLDRLFYAVMRRNLSADKAWGGISHERLEIALRIQRQCVDTMKTAGALDYMQSLAAAALPAPLPPENDERTVEAE